MTYAQVYWSLKSALWYFVYLLIHGMWNFVFVENDTAEINDSSLAGRMKFSEFDINKVIKNGSNLLACESSSVEVDGNMGN